MTTGSNTREVRDNASEVKFRVHTDTAGRLRERARSLLSPDPYAGGTNADEYTSTTIYFDTADYAVYGRRGSYRRAKYRVRRYGAGDLVFLERKLRTANYVSKRRTAVRIEDLPLLTAPSPDRSWEGCWFHERLLMRKLGAVSQVSYQRTARVGMTDYGPIRLTIDEVLRGLTIDEPEYRSGATTSLTDDAIIEMKFRGVMPVVFKQIVEEFALTPDRVSKYRLGIQAVRPGVAAAAAERRAAAKAARVSNA